MWGVERTQARVGDEVREVEGQIRQDHAQLGMCLSIQGKATRGFSRDVT